MTLRQPADERIHPHRVVMDDQPPVDMGGDVVLQQVSDVVVACSEVLGDVHGPPPRGQRSGSADRKCQDLSGLFQHQPTSSTVFPAAARFSIARNAAAPSARSYSTAGGGRSPFATSPAR